MPHLPVLYNSRFSPLDLWFRLVCMCTYVCICVCMHACMYVCMYTYACMYVCMYACMYMCMHGLGFTLVFRL